MLPNPAQAQGPYYLKAHWDFTNAFATAFTHSLNIQSLPPGNYLIDLTAGRSGSQQKFTKK